MSVWLAMNGTSLILIVRRFVEYRRKTTSLESLERKVISRNSIFAFVGEVGFSKRCSFSSFFFSAPLDSFYSRIRLVRASITKVGTRVDRKGRKKGGGIKFTVDPGDGWFAKP